MGGGGGVFRIGVLQALQMETSLGMMRPKENGSGSRGDLTGDSAESSRLAGRLFARWVRPERDLLRSFGAMVGGLGCCAPVC